MTEPLAIVNGQFCPASRALVSPIDAGFVLGVTVAEQLRTFAGRLFHLDDHLSRLEESLGAIGMAMPVARQQLAAAAIELTARNHKLLAEGDDLGLSIFVTPGTYAGYAPPGPIAPLWCLHTYELAFRLWADKYASGDALATTAVRQVPADCWPPTVKCRSRMHYFLADRQAAARFPASRAVLLDEDGQIAECSTANVVVYRRDEGLLSPRLTKVLHGISLAVAFDLAARQGIPVGLRDLSVSDLQSADEVLLTSTPLCVLPVVQFNGQPIGAGRPGPVFARLMAAWSEMVGVDIVGQARRFRER